MLELSATSYFKKQIALLPSIPATQKKYVAVKLEPSGYQKFENLPLLIAVAVYKPNTKQAYTLNTTGFRVTVGEFFNLSSFWGCNNIFALFFIDHWSGDLVDW